VVVFAVGFVLVNFLVDLLYNVLDPRIRHALRPSTFSLVTAAAVNVGALIGGAVIVETIFALPGMGDLTVQAIFRRDFLVVQFCVVVFAVGFVLVNFLV